MTVTYRATGSLEVPVSDLTAARKYLDEPMETYLDPPLVSVVHTIRWDLKNEMEWFVDVVTNRRLTDEESTALSEWISGQNSDGLGEGFEQQPFAEHFDEDSDHEEDDTMSSFDWQTNKCTLTLIRET